MKIQKNHVVTRVFDAGDFTGADPEMRGIKKP
jgi:hypothetical protein